MIIDEIKAEWKKDSIINQLKINDEIVRVPLLHSKYLDYYVVARAKLSIATQTLNLLKNKKRRYYRGEMSREEMLEYGWEAWQGLKPSLSEMKELFEQDYELNELQLKVDYWETTLNQIEYIMKEINGRQYALKTLVDLKKFEAGS
jgi:hypothetical protein